MNYIGEEKEDYEIHVYPGQNNEKEFYFDDGLTFNYEKDEYRLINVKLNYDSIEIKNVVDNFKIGNIDLVIHRDREIETIKNISINKKYSI